MSKFEPKDGKGSLFRNDKKEKETHPDYKGKIKVDGVLYWLSAWLNTKSDGEKYMSLGVTPVEERSDNDRTPSNAVPMQRFDDEDCPF